MTIVKIEQHDSLYHIVSVKSGKVLGVGSDMERATKICKIFKYRIQK